jgi:carbamoylphosphate synthase small subunit
VTCLQCPAAGDAELSFPEFLRRGGIVAIAEIDTRKLTRVLRDKGAHVRLHHDR